MLATGRNIIPTGSSELLYLDLLISCDSVNNQLGRTYQQSNNPIWRSLEKLNCAAEYFPKWEAREAHANKKTQVAIRTQRYDSIGVLQIIIQHKTWGCTLCKASIKLHNLITLER